MRPDMDDYAEIEETAPASSSRAMSWVVLAVAIGGFSALAYYAYHSGSASGPAGETLTVEADPSPIKEAPVNPDGAEFPNQDKTIYDVISPNGEAKTGEKLLPDPEHPVAAANLEDSEDDIPAGASAAAPAASTTTYVAPAAVPGVPPQTKPEGVAAAQAAAPAPAVNVAQPTPAPVAVPAQTVSEQPVVVTASKPVEKSYASPAMVNEKTITGKKEETLTAPAKPKPAQKPAAKADVQGAGGAYKIQLGAFKSQAEAEASWKKISAAHSAVLSGSPSIVKADVNGTTYYRLRAGSYANADAAKAACAKLGGQACFPVK